jgi:hypothetical protein
VGTDYVKSTIGSTADFTKLSLDPQVKKGLIENQTKINRLREEQEKMEREAFPFIDEIDILQKELENKDYAQRAS